MPIHLSEKDLTSANLTLHDDGIAVIRTNAAEHPTDTMTDAELLAYAAKQDGIYHDLSCRAVIPFFRRGWAFSIIFKRYPLGWTAFCKKHGIGRTWATHARKFYTNYEDESAIPTGKTLNELLIEAGILVQKVNTDEEEPTEPKRREPMKSASGAARKATQDDVESLEESGGDAEGDDVEPTSNVDDGGSAQPDSDQQAQAKKVTLLALLTRIKALLQLKLQDQNALAKEDLPACKSMAAEVISVCDQLVKEVDGHDPRQAA